MLSNNKIPSFAKGLDNVVLRILARTYDRGLFHQRFREMCLTPRVSFYDIAHEVLRTPPFSSINGVTKRSLLSEIKYQGGRQTRFSRAMDVAEVVRTYGLTLPEEASSYRTATSCLVTFPCEDLVITPYGLFFSVKQEDYHTQLSPNDEPFVPLPQEKLATSDQRLRRVSFVISYGYNAEQRFQTAQYVGSLFYPVVRTPAISTQTAFELSTFTKYVAREILAAERRLFDVLTACTLAYGYCNVQDLFNGLSYTEISSKHKKEEDSAGKDQKSSTLEEYFNSIIAHATQEYEKRQGHEAALDRAGFENVDSYVQDLCTTIPYVLETVRKLGEKYCRKLVGIVMLDAVRMRDLVVNGSGVIKPYEQTPLVVGVTKIDALLKTNHTRDEDPVFNVLFNQFYSSSSVF